MGGVLGGRAAKKAYLAKLTRLAVEITTAQGLVVDEYLAVFLDDLYLAFALHVHKNLPQYIQRVL